MNSAQQNQALADLDELLGLLGNLAQFRDDMRLLIVRNAFTSGQRPKRRAELGDMAGAPAPHYADPTGDAAVWDEMPDHFGKSVSSVMTMLRKCSKTTQELLSMVPLTEETRVRYAAPECLACGDVCVGRVLGGFDEKCHRRWVRAGRPDRARFMADTKAARKVSTSEEPSTELDY